MSKSATCNLREVVVPGFELSSEFYASLSEEEQLFLGQNYQPEVFGSKMVFSSIKDRSVITVDNLDTFFLWDAFGILRAQLDVVKGLTLHPHIEIQSDTTVKGRGALAVNLFVDGELRKKFAQMPSACGVDEPLSPSAQAHAYCEKIFPGYRHRSVR